MNYTQLKEACKIQLDTNVYKQDLCKLNYAVLAQEAYKEALLIKRKECMLKLKQLGVEIDERV